MNPLRSTNYWLNKLEIALKRSQLLSRPIEVCIEPTNRCNSECMMCTHPVHRRHRSIPFGDMSWETFLRTRPFWKYALRIDNGDVEGTMVVKVDDCTFHDFNEKMIKPYKD